MINEALATLRQYYGYKDFRRSQQEVIENILSRRDTVAIMPTGGGKSICYQIPALLFEGITVVISPLISLMKDQVDNIKELGISCDYINSSRKASDIEEIIKNLYLNNIKILYIAPERLESTQFCEIMKSLNISQVAIDEAHCVSQWGHDFRPSYRYISYFIKSLKSKPVITAFTATATEEVREDIVNLIELRNPKVLVAGFDRENLKIISLKGVERSKYLLKYIEKNKEDSGIIYAATRKEVDKIHGLLISKGIEAAKYHAGLSNEERKNNQEDFVYDRAKVIVATNAFGMGIDKSNVRFVIHFNMPKNIESYYQEIGRAGRDGEKSECIMLFSPQDIITQKFLIESGIESPMRRTNEYKKLQQMVDFIHYNGCLRNYILEYFGESKRGNECNNCSNCLIEGEVIDKTVDAQKVLSCIYRMKQSFGVSTIVDVLRGSSQKKLLQYNFQELSTYGIMKNYSKQDLSNFINTLIAHGYIDLKEGKFPTVILNLESMKILKNEKQVLLKEVSKIETVSLNNDLFEILRALRLDISKKEGVPPYIVFSDSSLKEMSSKYPRNEEEFMDISGVGKVKYERYGELFLSEILKYVHSNNINLKPQDKEGENISITSEKEEEDLSIALEKSSEFFQVKTDWKLYEKLRELREEIAKEEKVNSTKVFTMNTLKEISGRYPLTEEEFNDIGGVGPQKLEKYGNRFLKLIENYVKDKDIVPLWEYKGKLKLIIDGETRKDEEISIDKIKEGYSIDEISKALELHQGTIIGYIIKYIEAGNEIEGEVDLSSYYNKEEKEILLKIVHEEGSSDYNTIKGSIPKDIGYATARAVLLELLLEERYK